MPAAEAPPFDPAAGQTLLMPEVDAPGYWVGAPSAWVDDAALYLSVRHRRPLELGRGWKSSIYRTIDGQSLDEVWACTAADVGTESIERSALVREPGGRWHLYLSFVDPADRRWRIDRLEAGAIERLDASARIAILDAAGTDSEGVKDPVVWFDGGLTYLAAGYGPRTALTPAAGDRLHGTGNVFTTGLVGHPSGLWTSGDGRHFTFGHDLVTPGAGWDRNVARVSAVVPAGDRYLIYYDGRTGDGDVYEDRTGLATSEDLVDVRRLTDAGPILQGDAGTRCLRYLTVATFNGAILYIYESATAGGGHELRLNRVGGH